MIIRKNRTFIVNLCFHLDLIKIFREYRKIIFIRHKIICEIKMKKVFFDEKIKLDN